MGKPEDDFVRGWRLCLTTLANRHIRGVSSEAEELFRQIGSPSAKEVRRLGLTEYDRETLSQIRKACKQ